MVLFSEAPHAHVWHYKYRLTLTFSSQPTKLHALVVIWCWGVAGHIIIYPKRFFVVPFADPLTQTASEFFFFLFVPPTDPQLRRATFVRALVHHVCSHPHLPQWKVGNKMLIHTLSTVIQYGLVQQVFQGGSPEAQAESSKGALPRPLQRLSTPGLL